MRAQWQQYTFDVLLPLCQGESVDDETGETGGHYNPDGVYFGKEYYAKSGYADGYAAQELVGVSTEVFGIHQQQSGRCYESDHHGTQSCKYAFDGIAFLMSGYEMTCVGYQQKRWEHNNQRTQHGAEYSPERTGKFGRCFAGCHITDIGG